MRTYPKGVTPECFNRGSTMLTTTLSRVEWGSHFRSRLDSRWKHSGMTDYKRPWEYSLRNNT